MKITERFILFPSLLASLALPVTNAYADNPWLLEEGQSVVSISYVNEAFDQKWLADVRSAIPEISQQTTWVYYGKGLSGTMMVDVLAGFVSSSWDNNPALGDISGMADTRIRLRWNLRNEYYHDSGPTITVSGAAIFKGSYKRSQLTDINKDTVLEPNVHAPGDRAHGIELAVQIGQTLTDALSVSAELGYRVRFNDVPDDLLINMGAYYAMTDRISARVVYSFVLGQSGPDIGTAGVNPNVFHTTKEEVEGVEIAIDYSISHQHSVGVGLADVLDGRNTGDSSIYHMSYTYSF